MRNGPVNPRERGLREKEKGEREYRGGFWFGPNQMKPATEFAQPMYVNAM